MKKIEIIIGLLISTPSLAQDVDTLEISKLKNEIEILSASNACLHATVSRQGRQIEADKTAIDELSERLIENSNELKLVTSNLGISIDSISINVKEQGVFVKSKTEAITEKIHTNYLLIALCGFISLLLTIVVFFFAKLKIKLTQKNVEHLSETQRLLKDDNIRLDAHLLDILERGINSNVQKTAEPDHKFAISIANELARITQNLDHMDANVKGVSNLKNRVDAILTSLNTQGYEIPQLLGMNYNEGFNVIATMEQDDSLEEGVQIIKRIIKPQIIFKGKMIQAAEVVVAYNE